MRSIISNKRNLNQKRQLESFTFYQIHQSQPNIKYQYQFFIFFIPEKMPRLIRMTRKTITKQTLLPNNLQQLISQQLFYSIMQNSEQATKPSPVQLYILQDSMKGFSNPVSKTTFQALPRIYGKKKKKKYAIKYDFEDKEKETLKARPYPIHHCIHTNQLYTDSKGIVKEIEVSPPDKSTTRRIKTQIRNQIKEAAEKLSKPRSDICNRRYCFCNKQHSQRYAHSESKTQLKNAPRGRSVRLPEISRDMEPDDVESKHKVGMARLQQDGERKKRPFTLLDLLRSNQKSNSSKREFDSLDRNQTFAEEEDKTIPKVKHSQSVFVQTQFDYSQDDSIVETKPKQKQQQVKEDSHENEVDEEEKIEKKERILNEFSKEQKQEDKIKQNTKKEQQKPEQINQNQPIEQQNVSTPVKKIRSQEEQSKQELKETNKVEPRSRSISKASDHDPNRNQYLQKRLAELKENYQNNESGSDIDDSRSIASSMSNASISKYVFEKGKNTSTVFNTLNKQEKSNSLVAKSSVKSEKLKKEGSPQGQKKKQKFAYQKKNGLFIIPEEDQYVTYLKDYEPMSEKFKMKQVLRSENFKVVKSDEGIYFGQMIDAERHGKGIMVTEKNIFEGKYNKDIKIQGCEKNIDGIYRGQFMNGVREGYGTFQWYNGEVFQGQWRNGTKNGYGVWKSPKGDFYEGEWKMNRQHGKGLFKHRLSTYRGYFVDFLKNGQGEQIFTNGDKYIGMYKEGKPHGKGKYQWADGSYYQGQFVKGVRQGYGIWKYINGTIYEGEFKNDFKNGKGKERYRTGQRFQGQFREGEKFEGILFDANNNQIQITQQH